MILLWYNKIKMKGYKMIQIDTSNVDFGRVNLYNEDENFIGYLNGLTDIESTEEKFDQIADLWNSTNEASFTVKINKIQLLKLRIRTLWWIFISKINKKFKR